MESLINLSACKVVNLLDKGEITPHELLDALEKRIDMVDGQVNALPTLCFKRAHDHAQRLLKKPVSERGLLRGLPIPIKDLTPVSGVRTTFGSKVYADYISESSDLLVERLEANGGIVYAKSNTPEFGAGGNTFNEVFGPTRNPHDLSRSAGGSSGGAAAALASGTAWLAHGSDLAGSLRTPASFCGIVSLRPSPGLITSGPVQLPFQVLAQEGPMARTINDLALFTDAMAGQSMLAGIAKPELNESFLSASRRPIKPVRVAFSADLGITKTSDEVRSVCEKAMRTIEKDGVIVEENQPDLSEAHNAFSTLRALSYAIELSDDLSKFRHLIKPEVVWNIEQGINLDCRTIRNAMVAQGRVFENAAHFMHNYDLLICPAAIVPPIPLEERYLGFNEGVKIDKYYHWLAITYAITVTSMPVITLPCGTTSSGLPIGVQLIGRPHGEQRLFSYARYFEQVVNYPDEIPIEPRQ